LDKCKKGGSQKGDRARGVNAGKKKKRDSWGYPRHETCVDVYKRRGGKKAKTLGKTQEWPQFP